MKFRLKFSTLFEYFSYFTFAYIIVIMAPYLYRSLPVKIVAAKDVSLEEKVFIWTVRFKEIKRGDYIEFIPPPSIYTLNKVLIKKVACLPGEKLEVKKAIENKEPGNDIAYEYYCNGDFIGYSLKTDRDGRKVQSYTQSGELKGYFVIGTHKRSYDSRYFGPVNNGQIIAKVIPIF